MVMKVYSFEFKADAVALYDSDPDLTIAQVARDLGINAETLRNWIRRDRTTGSGGHRARKNVTSTTAPADAATIEVLQVRWRACGPSCRRPQGDRHGRRGAGHPAEGDQVFRQEMTW